MTACVPHGGAETARYPLKPDPYSSHGVVARELRRLARAARPGPPVVLDAGCGAGALATLLAGEPLHLVGIDSDAGALAQARVAGYATLARADLEGEELPELAGSVDVLVCADVLEHCRRPEAVLRRLLCHYLPDGGAVIVSLPNVAHWYVRAQLLVGRWPYAERGILDRTHLRFFTGTTGAALLASARVAVVRRLATPLPLPVLWPACAPGRPLYWAHVANAWLTRLRPPLLAYQFVYVGSWAGDG